MQNYWFTYPQGSLLAKSEPLAEDWYHLTFVCVLQQGLQSGSIATLAEILSLIHKAMQLFRRHSYISLSKSKTR